MTFCTLNTNFDRIYLVILRENSSSTNTQALYSLITLYRICIRSFSWDNLWVRVVCTLYSKNSTDSKTNDLFRFRKKIENKRLPNDRSVPGENNLTKWDYAMS